MSSTTQTRAHASSPWIVNYRPDPRARLRLFCFPYAGGGAVNFRQWAERLPEGVESCCVQPPGRGARMGEPLFTRLAPLVREIAVHITPHLDRPFAFFGHSMGALMAFELARLLRSERGLLPARLFVSGCDAPQFPYTEAPTYDLPDDLLREELRRLNGTPREVLEHPELMLLMFPLLRADLEVVQTYRCEDGPPLECPISAYGGLEDPEVSRERLEGWRRQTSASFSLEMLEGDHFFLNSSREQLLRLVSGALRRMTEAPELRGGEQGARG